MTDCFRAQVKMSVVCSPEQSDSFLDIALILNDID